MNVRPARPGDEATLLALLEEVHAAFEEEPPPPEAARRLVGEAVAGRGLTFLVAEAKGGEIEGLLSLALVPTTRDAAAFAYLDDLYVRPGSRGQGVALELLGAARRWAAAAGATEIRLAADFSDEGLWHLYREAGYERQRMSWMLLRLGRDWSGRRP